MPGRDPTANVVTGSNWSPVDAVATVESAISKIVTVDTLSVDPVIVGQALTLGIDDTLILVDGVGGGHNFGDSTLYGGSDLFGDIIAPAAMGIGKGLADTASLSDATSLGVTKVFADTVALVDQLATQSAFFKSMADSITLADSLTPAAGFDKTLADSLSLLDDVQTQVFHLLAQQIDDTVSLADALSFVTGYQRNLADTVTLSDLLSSTAGYDKSLADTATLADAVAFIATYARTIADPVNLSDTLSPTATYERNIVDTVTLSDFLSLESSGITPEVAVALMNLLGVGL